jgi:hypothetical protein
LFSFNVDSVSGIDRTSQGNLRVRTPFGIITSAKAQGFPAPESYNVPAPLTTRDLLEFATIEGARANGLADRTGTLTPGKEADIIMLRTDRPNIFPINDPIGAVVWGMDTSNVDTVFVGGKALKRNGQLVGVDLNRIQKMAYESRDYVVNTSGFTLPNLNR